MRSRKVRSLGETSQRWCAEAGWEEATAHLCFFFEQVPKRATEI